MTDPVDVVPAIENAQAVGSAPELLDAQVVKVLNALVAKYVSGKLDETQALVGIGVIAELRQLKGKLLRAVQRGQEAASTLTGSRK